MDKTHNAVLNLAGACTKPLCFKGLSRVDGLRVYGSEVHVCLVEPRLGALIAQSV